MQILECCKAILYGILEGITEWLPISSTGHLILLAERLPFRFCTDAVLLEEFWELFEVVIQLGAILAVVVLFWQRLSPARRGRTDWEVGRVRRLWSRVLLASVPAAVAGILLDRALLAVTGKDIDGWLYCAPVVAFSLIFYGAIFLLMGKKRRTCVDFAESVSKRQAIGIGAFQMLALVPGTSRSGATMLGAELFGVSRKAGAEFSFFMAIPVMLGASAVKSAGFLAYVMEEGTHIPSDAWLLLLVGCATAFLTSLVVIRFLLDFVKRYSFAPFGVYRIALGLLVFCLRW